MVVTSVGYLVEIRVEEEGEEVVGSPGMGEVVEMVMHGNQEEDERSVGGRLSGHLYISIYSMYCHITSIVRLQKQAPMSQCLFRRELDKLVSKATAR